MPDQAKSGVITDETKLPPPVESLCGFDTGELERKWNELTKKKILPRQYDTWKFEETKAGFVIKKKNPARIPKVFLTTLGF